MNINKKNLSVKRKFANFILFSIRETMQIAYNIIFSLSVKYHWIFWIFLLIFSGFGTKSVWCAS
jgi:hypothetical protein